MAVVGKRRRFEHARVGCACGWSRLLPFSRIVHCWPGPSPWGTGGVTSPAGVPSSPVRGQPPSTLVHWSTRLPCRAVPGWQALISAPNMDAKAVLTALPPCSGCLPTSAFPPRSETGFRRPGFGHRDAGRRCAARKCPFPLCFLLQGAWLRIVGRVSARATVSGGWPEGRPALARCHASRAMPCHQPGGAAWGCQGRSGAGRCVLARPDPVSAVRAGIGRSAVRMLAVAKGRG